MCTNGEGNGTPLQYSCLENPMDGGAWWAAVHGVAKSQTWLNDFTFFTFMHWRRKWQPTPVFLPRESRDGGAWWAAVYGAAQSRTRLKRLSSSSKVSFTHFRYSAKHMSWYDIQVLSWIPHLPSVLQSIFSTSSTPLPICAFHMWFPLLAHSQCPLVLT